MPPSDDQNKIEELKKSLYSRTSPDVRTRRKLRFSDSASDVQKSWGDADGAAADPVLNREYEDHSMSFLVKILIGSAIFCVIAIGVGAYLFFDGANLISADNIDITINGPVSIPGGEPVSFDVEATNKNNVDLQLVDMEVDFPAGTTDPTDPTKTLTVYHQLIGDLAAGASAHETVEAIIFGEENMQKTISVTLTYQVKGSTALFTKVKTYDVLINSSPITVTATSFSQITSGQEFDIKVDLKSNSQETLKDVLLKADYPFGYTFLSSDLQPLSDNATWNIGDIPPGADRTVTIHGKLVGEDTDTRAFHFTVGAQSSSDATVIGTEYMAVEDDMTIQKPFISLGIEIAGDDSTSDYVGQFNQASRVQIDWFNNLPTAVSDVVITAKLSGSAYDKTHIEPDEGYFDSADDEIIWNTQTNPELQSVAAGASGNVSFSVIPTDLSSTGNAVVDPTVTFDVSVAGTRTQESNVPESLTAEASRNIKVSSNIALSGRVVRSTGPFGNFGPIPPVAEQATTYTVVWTIDNTTSAVDNAAVTAALPPYVTWLGNTSPASESMSYATDTGIVTWNIGNVGAYSLGSSQMRQVSFQISLKPSITQVETAPTLVNQSTLTATDDFTGAALTSTQDYLTTSYSTDPTYKEGDETVVAATQSSSQ